MIVFDGVEYLTSKEVMDMIGYSRSALMRRVREGRLSQIKKGGRSYFKKSDIEELIGSDDHILLGDTGVLLYTTKELADLLGVNVGTLYRWHSNGFFRGTKIGHRTFYTEDNIRTLINKLKEKCDRRPKIVRDQFGVK